MLRGILMNFNIFKILIILPFVALLFLNSNSFAKDIESKRADILQKEVDTLEQLYSIKPSAKRNVQNAAGYAVFSNFGMKILLAGGGKGSGVAVNNKTKKKTYMKMLQLQAGPGFGVEKFRQVWIFVDTSDLHKFINSGWELSAQGSAAAKVADQGAEFSGALSIKPGVWLYHITETGLALQLVGKGTKYYKDDKLN